MGINQGVKVKTRNITLDPKELLYDMRCEKCKKLLGKVAGRAQIKCDRCSAVNDYLPLASNKNPFGKISDVEQRILSERLSKSFSTELFSVDEKINSFLLEIWHAGNGIKVPSDLFFEGNIPLFDCSFWVNDQDVPQNSYRFRVLVFDDDNNENEDQDTECGEEITVGALRIWANNEKVSKRTIMVTLPIIVIRGFQSIVLPVRELETCAVIACDDKDSEIATDFFKALYISCLKTWYGVQVAILHPEIRKIVKKEQICVSHDLKEHSDDEYKEDKKRNERRIYHHVKRIYINQKDLEQTMFGGCLHKSINRKSRLWYVCGHWRSYKSGLETFIHPYWKGIDRNNDLKILDERERLLDMTEEARRELHGTEEILEG